MKIANHEIENCPSNTKNRYAVTKNLLCRFIEQISYVDQLFRCYSDGFGTFVRKNVINEEILFGMLQKYSLATMKNSLTSAFVYGKPVDVSCIVKNVLVSNVGVQF